MIQKILSDLAAVQKKYPVLIILLVLTGSLFFLYYALQIETNSSFDVLFQKDSQSMKLKHLMANEFGSTDQFFIMIEIDDATNDKTRIHDIRHPDVITSMKKLSVELLKEQDINEVTSIADYLELYYGKLPDTLDESKWMIRNFRQIADISFLINDENSALNIAISANVGSRPGSLQKIEDIINEKIKAVSIPVGVKFTLTGIKSLLNRIMDLLISDNIRTILIALAGVFLVLWIYFKSHEIALIAISPVILTLICLAGAMYLMDIQISVIVASVGAMMVGMGIDYSIHLTHAFEENYNKKKDKAVFETVVFTGSALIISCLTTIAGFAAMMLGNSPNSQIQGRVLAVGIIFAFLLAILLVPPLMLIQRKLMEQSIESGKTCLSRTNNNNSFQKKFLKALALIQVKYPKRIIAAIVLLTLIAIPGMTKVRFDTDNDQWIPDDDPVMQALSGMTRNFGGIDSQNYLFMLNGSSNYPKQHIIDLRDPKILSQMSVLDNYLADLPWVDRINSPTISIKQFNQDKIPNNINDIKKLIREHPQIQSNFNDDYTIAKYSLNTDSMTREQYFEALDLIGSISFPEELTIIPQGGIAEEIDSLDSLQKDTTKTTLIGFAFVILIASLFYLSFIAGLLAFFPIIFAMIWTIGGMGWIDLPFTILTSGMLAILMGMGIDFSIHLIHHTKRHIDEGESVEYAITESVTSSGGAILITTITTVIGFFALAFATLKGTHVLGYTLALGIVMTFISCMLLVPAILSIKYSRQKKSEAKTK